MDLELFVWIIFVAAFSYMIYGIMKPTKLIDPPRIEPVDTIPPMPILTRSGDMVEPEVEKQVQSQPETVNTQITDSVTHAAPEPIKEIDMATKKPAPEPKKAPAKKAPAKKPKK